MSWVDGIEYEIMVDTLKKQKEELETLRKALTPPTAEEVISEIKKWKYYSEEINAVDYAEKTHMFRVETKRGTIFVITFRKNGITIPVQMQPHLITLIGRFYESVVSL